MLVQVTGAIRSCVYLDAGEDSRFCIMIPCANERTPDPGRGLEGDGNPDLVCSITIVWVYSEVFLARLSRILLRKKLH